MSNFTDMIARLGAVAKKAPGWAVREGADVTAGGLFDLVGSVKDIDSDSILRALLPTPVYALYKGRGMFSDLLQGGKNKKEKRESNRGAPTVTKTPIVEEDTQVPPETGIPDDLVVELRRHNDVFSDFVNAMKYSRSSEIGREKNNDRTIDGEAKLIHEVQVEMQPGRRRRTKLAQKTLNSSSDSVTDNTSNSENYIQVQRDVHVTTTKLLPTLVDNSREESDKIDRVIDVLGKIEKNTTPNRQQQREDEIELRNKEKLRRAMDGEKTDGTRTGIGGAIASGIEGILGDVVSSYLGLKTAQAVFGRKTGANLPTTGTPTKPTFARRLLSGAGRVFKPVAIAGGAAAAAMSAPSVSSTVANAMGSAGSIAQNTTSKTIELAQNAKAAAMSAPSVSSTVANAMGSAGSIAQNTTSKTIELAQNAKAAAPGVIESAKNRLAALYDDAARATSEIADSAKPTIKAMSESAASFKDKALSSLKTTAAGAAKILGTPLTFATGLYDAWQIDNDPNMSDEEKKIAYSRIGGRTLGAIAGAKMGAAGGAAVGAAVGSPFAGVGAAPGAGIGAIIGGIGGGIAGYFGGEELGGIAGEAAFGDTKPQQQVKTNVEVIPQTNTLALSEKALSDNLGTLPPVLRDYITGASTDVKLIDVAKPLNDFLVSHGIDADQATAGIALVNARNAITKTDLRVRHGSSLNIDQIEQMAAPASSNVFVTKSNSPDIETSIGQRRATAMESLNRDIESSSIKKDLAAEQGSKVVVIQQQAAQQAIANETAKPPRERLSVPASRNQDGTIQRLLDKTVRPILE